MTEQLFHIELTCDELVMLILDMKQLHKIVYNSPFHISDVPDSGKVEKLRNIKHLHDLLDGAYDNQIKGLQS